jgi:hypothetical protein
MAVEAKACWASPTCGSRDLSADETARSSSSFDPTIGEKAGECWWRAREHGRQSAERRLLLRTDVVRTPHDHAWPGYQKSATTVEFIRI